MQKLRWSLILAPLPFLLGCAVFKDRSELPPKLTTVQWKAKNIIIVLGMKSERSGTEVVLPKMALPRVREAERLYRQCKAAGKTCWILASGGDPGDNGVAEAELIKRMLLKNQVPGKDILTEGTSNTTSQNAKYSSEMLSQHSPDLTVLVTNDIHVARALKNFEEYKVFPLPAPTETPL